MLKNISEKLIRDVHIKSNYSIRLKGSSQVGYGLASVLTKNYSPETKNDLISTSEKNIFNKEADEKNLRSLPIWIIFTCGSVILLLLGISSWFCIQKRYKLKRDAQRSHYIKVLKLF